MMSHEKYAAAVRACAGCAISCDHCAIASLRSDDVNSMSRCVSLAIDCAQLCRVAGALMTRDSPFVDAICQVCADACDVCSAECARRPESHCRECAQQCRRCAEACRRTVEEAQAGAATS
jgi:hypothetical protein